MIEQVQPPALTPRGLAVGAVAMAGANISKIAIQLTMLPLMARLLGPGEFGLYALALPTVTFLQMLADGGLGNSLSRESESSDEIWSTAFWVLQGFCAALGLAVVGWSFILAQIVHQPRLPGVMSVLAISLMLFATSVLPSARLMRRARMGVGAIADLASNLIGAAVGVGLALHHAGAWSLVGQYMTGFAIKTLVVNVAAPSLPKFSMNLGALRPHLAVGGAIAGSKVADYVGRLTENTLIIRILGAPVLGAYSFGNQVPRFICESASNPAWAILYVQALRKDNRSVLQAYYNSTRLLAMILFPVVTIVAALTPGLVPILLGQSWRSAIPVIAVLLPTYAFFVVGSQSAAILNAYGRSKISLFIAICAAVARILAVGCAPFYGLPGVALGIGMVNIFIGIIYIFVPAKAIGANPTVVFTNIFGTIVCSLIGGALCMLLMQRMPNSILGIFGAASLSGICTLSLLVFIERRRLVDDLTLLKSMIGLKR